jgi:hypothetical protein
MKHGRAEPPAEGDTESRAREAEAAGGSAWFYRVSSARTERGELRSPAGVVQIPAQSSCLRVVPSGRQTPLLKAERYDAPQRRTRQFLDLDSGSVVLAGYSRGTGRSCI